MNIFDIHSSSRVLRELYQSFRQTSASKSSVCEVQFGENHTADLLNSKEDAKESISKTSEIKMNVIKEEPREELKDGKNDSVSKGTLRLQEEMPNKENITNNRDISLNHTANKEAQLLYKTEACIKERRPKIDSATSNFKTLPIVLASEVPVGHRFTKTGSSGRSITIFNCGPKGWKAIDSRCYHRGCPLGQEGRIVKASTGQEIQSVVDLEDINEHLAITCPEHGHRVHFHFSKRELYCSLPSSMISENLSSKFVWYLYLKYKKIISRASKHHRWFDYCK